MTRARAAARREKIYDLCVPLPSLGPVWEILSMLDVVRPFKARERSGALWPRLSGEDCNVNALKGLQGIRLLLS